MEAKTSKLKLCLALAACAACATSRDQVQDNREGSLRSFSASARSLSAIAYSFSGSVICIPAQRMNWRRTGAATYSREVKKWARSALNGSCADGSPKTGRSEKLVKGAVGAGRVRGAAHSLPMCRKCRLLCAACCGPRGDLVWSCRGVPSGPSAGE